MIIKQLAHICIGAPDLQDAEQFYCQGLGMERGFDFIKEGRVVGFYVKCGAHTFIEIFEQTEIDSVERPIMQHLCLEVQNIDRAIAEIRANGLTVTDKKQGGDHSWQAWMTDPGGVRIEIMQYSADSTQFSGEPCIIDW
ncbi:MAG: VOC family protein [Anaerolineae bacterium]